MNKNPDFVKFGDVARDLCGEQCQYVSRCVDGKIEGYPSLGQNLRFQGTTSNYHSLMIHKDDVEEFVTRYLTWDKFRKGLR